MEIPQVEEINGKQTEYIPPSPIPEISDIAFVTTTAEDNILNNGNPANTSTDIILANPTFIEQSAEMVLANKIDASNLPGTEQGAMSVPFAYFDEAVSTVTGLGRYYETTSNHTINQEESALNTNVPASIYQTPVTNAGARFMR